MVASSISLMIITCKKLILKPSAQSIDNAAVAIKHGTIQAVGPVGKITNKNPGHRVLRLDNAVLMPGLVNLHTHLELPSLLNAVRAKTFTDWVLSLIHEKKNLSNSDYLSATSDNIDTLIRSGTTSVGEISTHGVSPVSLRQRGLRARVFSEIISMSDHDADPAAPSFDGGRQKGRITRGSEGRLVQSGLSPHTPYTVSEAALRRIVAMINKKNIRIAMHVAESKDEIKLLQRKKTGLKKLYQFAHWDISWAPRGSTSFEYLNRIGVLSPNLLAVHAIQVTDEDIMLIKQSQTSVAHCPRSNKELSVGRMPLKKFLDAGISVGLGTDSLASSPSLNMWDEMRYAYKIHRRDGVTSVDIFTMATIGGTRALGMDKETGLLEAGKRADIIAVPLPKKNTGNLYSDLIRETESCIMTMVDGKILFFV